MILMNLLYSTETTLCCVLIEMTLAIDVKDAVKFSGYEPANINGNSKTCYEYPPNCIQSCILNDLCTAIETHHQAARCDSIRLVFYGRVILNRNPNSTTWVKGLRIYTYFNLFDIIAQIENQEVHYISLRNL